MAGADESLEFDDELLSAYLDDELAPEARAHVEARLAADSQARQLLEELKAVSRAVQGLPAATLDADLRESVLRRAERAMLVPGERVSASGPDEKAWRMPFGRSKRSWFWAGAALAAGLLLMVYDRAAEHDQNLPNEVALRGRDAVIERGPLVLRSVDEVREPSVGFADKVRSARPATVASESDALALREDASGTEGGSVVGTNAAAYKERDLNPAGDRLVVVHVNVNPEALRNRTFDAVLYNNDIEVERPERPVGFEAQAATSGDMDLVLVEAAPLQVFRCLDALEADRKNYLDIEVEDQSTSNHKSRAEAEPAESLQKYNRGVVPPRQKIAFVPNRDYYFYFESARGRVESDRTLTGKREEVLKAQDKLSRSGTASGRAKRMDAESGAPHYGGGSATAAPIGVGGAQLSATESSALSSPESPQNYSETTQSHARRAVQKLATKADMLQVLFVFSSEQPPESGPASTLPSASSQPATSPPTDDSVR